MNRLFLLLLLALSACVEPATPEFATNVNVVVVDGTITNLDEPQTIRLSRSRADPYTGLLGETPLTGAQTTIIVNDTENIMAREISPGVYQLPATFRGRVGDRYRLRFQVTDGTRYESSSETMLPVPPIERITDQYNPDGLPTDRPVDLLAANDLYIETTDPAEGPNYYRWDWVLWERQSWCRTCTNGYYYEYDDSGKLIDGCVPFPYTSQYPVFFDYECKTDCWDIFYSNQLNLFADKLTNGQAITGRRVAQIPFYQYRPALVEIRQSALTPTAYAYFNLLQQQSERTGGLTDTPPTVPIGNVRNVMNAGEPVFGYFTASGVSAVRYWLTRTNTAGGLPFRPGINLTAIFFRILNQRDPVKENLLGVRGRPPLAVCMPGNTRTPVKPTGWQD